MPEIIKVVSTATPIKVISNLIPGPTGATGAAGPNTVTSATTSNGTCDLSVASLTGSVNITNGKHIHINSGGLIEVKSGATFEIKSGATVTISDQSAFRTAISAANVSHTHGNISNVGAIGTSSGMVVTTTTGGVLTTSSASGIDTRTSFPNSTVSAATNSATPNTLVLRDANGLIGNEIILTGEIPDNEITITLDGDDFTLSYAGMTSNKPAFSFIDGTNDVSLQYEIGTGWVIVWTISGIDNYVASLASSAQLPWEDVGSWSVTEGTEQPIFSVFDEQTSKRLLYNQTDRKYYTYDGEFRELPALTTGGQLEVAIINASLIGTGGLQVGGSGASFIESIFVFDSTSRTNMQNAIGGLVGAPLMAADTIAAAKSALGMIEVVKRAPTTMTNTTTLTIDPHLQIALTPGLWEMEIFTTTSDSPGSWKYQLRFPTIELPTSPSIWNVLNGNIGAGVISVTNLVNGNTATPDIVSASGRGSLSVKMMLNTASSGLFAVWWAPNTLSPNPNVVRAGRIVATRIGNHI